MLPKHENPTNLHRTTTAPYNFIPLPDQIFDISNGIEVETKEGKKKIQPWEHQDEFIDGTLSGWLDLTITTETPTYIRCGLSEEDDQKQRELESKGEGAKKGKSIAASHHFFNHGNVNNSVIPGSSIRGMVRSLVEILAFGKMNFVNDQQQLVYRAVGDMTSLGQNYRREFSGNGTIPTGYSYNLFEYPLDSIKGGYLFYDNHDQVWKIQPAKEYPNGIAHKESFVHIEYHLSGLNGKNLQYDKIYGSGDIKEVYVIPPTRIDRPTSNDRGIHINIAITSPVAPTIPGSVKAYLIRSGHMGGRINKHMHCAIYEPDFAMPPNLIAIEVWKLYEQDRGFHRGLNTRKLGQDEPTINIAGRTLWPCFYMLDSGGRIKFFGPTMMFRIPYEHQILEFIPQEKKLDLAEIIFGRVKEKIAGNQDELPDIKGRVFFEDAVCDPVAPFFNENDGRKIPQILGQPKSTSFQLYLVQPDVANNTPAANKKRTLHNWGHPLETSHSYQFKDNQDNLLGASKGTIIRGYKLYWHKNSNDDVIWAEPQNARFEIDSEGNYFIYKIEQDQRKYLTQYTIIRPVQKGTTFISKIRFKNLTHLEFGSLLAAMELNGSNNIRHHLGMGKPLGMGTVKIETKKYLIDPHVRYELFYRDGKLNEGFMEDAKRDIEVKKASEIFSKTLTKHFIKVDKSANALQTQNQPKPAKSVMAQKMSAFLESNSQPAKELDYWEIPRIASLLTMMKWPGPSINKTRYKTFEGDDRECWRERKVLPTPEAVECYNA